MHTVYPLRLWRSLFLRWLSLVLAVMGWGICTMAHAANIDWAQTSGPPGTVRSLAIDPKTPATLYAGTYDGVFMSIDSGENWSTVWSVLTNSIVRSLAIDPKAPATLYAGLPAAFSRASIVARTGVRY